MKNLCSLSWGGGGGGGGNRIDPFCPMFCYLDCSFFRVTGLEINNWEWMNRRLSRSGSPVLPSEPTAAFQGDHVAMGPDTTQTSTRPKVLGNNRKGGEGAGAFR